MNITTNSKPKYGWIYAATGVIKDQPILIHDDGDIDKFILQI